MFLAWSQTLKGTIGPLYYEENERALALAREKRRQLRAFLVNDVRDAEAKARLLAEADAAVARVKRGCDLLVGTQLVEGLTDAERETWRAELLIEHTAKETLTSDKAQRALAAARKHNAFHWFLEFPEVFEGGGALTASGRASTPSWATRRSSADSAFGATLGGDYLQYLKHRWSHRQRLRRLLRLSSSCAPSRIYAAIGHLGLIATNTIAQGDTRELGLDHIVQRGGIVYRAATIIPWPGQAAVVVDIVHIVRGPYRGDFTTGR